MPSVCVKNCARPGRRPIIGGTKSTSSREETHMRRALRFAVLVTSATVAYTGLSAQSPPDPIVTVETGALRGVVHDGVVSYLGVPYATPPVGSLRWRQPQPPAKWQGVRSADTFGNDCVQHRQYDQPQSEDCLYL